MHPLLWLLWRRKPPREPALPAQAPVPRGPMTSSAGGIPSTNDLGPAAEARLSSFNAVFTLALILTQVSSPDQVMRLVTTSIPSIVSCQQALIWQLARSGEYYQRAPEAIGEILAELTGAGPLEVADFPPSWAFPITNPIFWPNIACRPSPELF